uniref:Uncharacterized protein n=1 Tax=Rhizophagus irregularis (strain DAOM 181602 / DAOM 197198 / MUCL 43194) TaxID=747089 RepID=U9T1P2_RHIID
MYQSLAPENDSAELNVLNDSRKYFSYNDQDLHEMLRIFVSKNNLKLAELNDPSLSVFLPFTCEYKDLKDNSSQKILRNIIIELKAHLKTIPINGNEALKLQYICSYFVGIAQNAIQLESALSNRKCKASEIEEEDVFTRKTFGIITDAEKWYLMECSLDNKRKPSF